MTHVIPSAQEVELAVGGRVGLMTLNRPKALNAINLNMVRHVTRALDLWEHDPDIDAILIRSASPRAFSAGGDVRAIGVLPDPVARVSMGADFFREEFALNCRINRLAKPYISLIRGITMGGGLGLSVHGSHRVVAEDVRMAMPETVLGYFPDIGASWFLNRCPGHLGRYLALTGAQIGAGDALFSKLATHHVLSGSFDALTNDLISAGGLDDESVGDILRRHASHAEPGYLPEHAAKIDGIFGQDELDAVLGAINRSSEASEWIRQAAISVQKAAPISLQATWLRMLNGHGQSVEDILTDDYRQALRMIERADFAEGVRAILVDKDHSPKWSPPDLRGIGNEDVASLLRPFDDPAMELRF